VTLHSFTSQSTYWSANSSRALRCAAVSLGPAAGDFEDRPPSLSLLRTVCSEIVTPRAAASRPARIFAGNPLSRSTERWRKRSFRAFVDRLRPDPGLLVNSFVSRKRERVSCTVLWAMLRCCAIYRTFRPSLFKATI
jgi:hypothetical protein